MEQHDHHQREAHREAIRGRSALTHEGISLPPAGRHGYVTVNEWGNWMDRINGHNPRKNRIPALYR